MEALQFKSPSARSQDSDGYDEHEDCPQRFAVDCGPSTPRWMQRSAEALQQPSPSISSNSSAESLDGSAVHRSPSTSPSDVKADLVAFFANYVSGDDSSDN